MSYRNLLIIILIQASLAMLGSLYFSNFWDPLNGLFSGTGFAIYVGEEEFWCIRWLQFQYMDWSEKIRESVFWQDLCRLLVCFWQDTTIWFNIRHRLMYLAVRLGMIARIWDGILDL